MLTPASAGSANKTAHELCRELIKHFSEIAGSAAGSLKEKSKKIVACLEQLLQVDLATTVLIDDQTIDVAAVMGKIQLTRNEHDMALHAAEKYTPPLVATLDPSAQLHALSIKRLGNQWVGYVDLDGEQLFLQDLPPTPPLQQAAQQESMTSPLPLNQEQIAAKDDSRQKLRRVMLLYGESGIGKTFRLVSSITDSEVGLYICLSHSQNSPIVQEHIQGASESAEKISECVMSLMTTACKLFVKKEQAFDKTQLVVGFDECGSQKNFVRFLIRHSLAVERALKERWKFAAVRFVLAGTGLESPQNRAGSDLSTYSATLVTRPQDKSLEIFSHAARTYFRSECKRLDPSLALAIEVDSAMCKFVEELCTKPIVQKLATNGRLSRLLAFTLMVFIPHELWQSHELDTFLHSACLAACCQYRRENGLARKTRAELAHLSLELLKVIVTDTCDAETSEWLCVAGVMSDTARYVADCDFKALKMVDVSTALDSGTKLVYDVGSKRYAVTPAMRFMIVARFGLAKFGSGEEFEDTMMCLIEMQTLAHCGEKLIDLIRSFNNDTSTNLQDGTGGMMLQKTPNSKVLNVTGKMEVRMVFTAVVCVKRDQRTLQTLDDTLSKAKAIDDSDLALVRSRALDDDNDDDDERKTSLLKSIRQALKSGFCVLYEGSGMFFLCARPWVVPSECTSAGEIPEAGVDLYRVPKTTKEQIMRDRYEPTIPSEVQSLLENAQRGELLLVRNGAKSCYADIILFIKGMHMVLFQCKNCELDITAGQVSTELRKMGHPAYVEENEDDAFLAVNPNGRLLTQALQKLCGVDDQQVTYCFLLNRRAGFKASGETFLSKLKKPETKNVVVSNVAADELPFNQLPSPPFERAWSMMQTAHGADGAESAKKKLRLETQIHT